MSNNTADHEASSDEPVPVPRRFEEDVATAVRLSETRLQRPVAVEVMRDGETTEPVTKPGSRRGDPPVIWYGSYLDTAPPRVRGWTAAHEVSHVVLGHPDSGRWHTPAFRAAVCFLALGWVVAMIVVVVETAGPDLSWVVGGLALTTLGLLVPGLAAIVGVDNFFSRRGERAADAWATELVGPLSDADRDWLKRHAGRPLDPRPPGEGPPSERAPIVTRTHPRWDTRGHPREQG